MSIKINRIERKTIKQKLWKTANLMVGVVTVINVSMLGVLVQPRLVQAATLRSHPWSDQSSSVTETSNQSNADSHNQTPDVTNNPNLDQSCGLDIGLNVDISASIDSDEMALMKTALTNFANAFIGTPTVFSLTSFASSASIKRAFPLSPSQAAEAITSDIPQAGESDDNEQWGKTNWDAGLAQSFDSFDPRTAKPNLMVIATDGSPNRWGYPITDPSSDWDIGLSRAIDRANSIKALGTRIVTIGIGNDSFDPATPDQKLEKLQAISGSNVALTPGTITTATDVIKTSDFTGIGDALASFARKLCGGKILVQKQLDTDGDGRADVTGSSPHQVLAGWQFDVDGSPSDLAPQTTSETGSLSFNVLSGTYSVQELNRAANTELEAVSCVKGEKSVGTTSIPNRTVSDLNIEDDETISCTFLNMQTTGNVTVNKNFDDDGNGSNDRTNPEGWTWDIVGGSLDNNGGATKTLAAGTYVITEDTIASYSSSWSCSNTTSGTGTSFELSLHPGQNIACTFTNRKAVPDLVVSKSDGLERADPGQTISYTMVVSNSGSAQAGGVVVTDTLPPQATYLRSTLDGVASVASITLNPSGDVLVWNSGDLNSGASKTLVVTVVLDPLFPNGTTTMVNTVKVSTTTPEPNTENNSASDTTKVSAAPTLGLQKSASPAMVPAGHNITWTLTWSIGGTATATSIVINDQVSSNTVFVSAADGGTYNATTNAVTWDLGTKKPGSSGVVHFVVKSASPLTNGTVITNAATIDSAETEPLAASATVTITSAPSLSITKKTDVNIFANPGTAVTYTVTVVNSASANEAAKNVVVTDLLPSGFSYAVDGATVKSFSVGTLSPGQSATVTYLVNISGTQAAGTYLNAARAKADNAPEVTATALVEVRLPQILAAVTKPSLTISKRVSASRAQPGDIVTFTVTVKNVGDGDAMNVIIADTLPTGLSFVYEKGRSKTWEVGTLKAGRSRTIDFDVRIDSTAKNGKYENIATVVAEGLPKKQARAHVNVAGPKALGLVTTGPGNTDYAIILIGLLLATAGWMGLRKDLGIPRYYYKRIRLH